MKKNLVLCVGIALLSFGAQILSLPEGLPNGSGSQSSQGSKDSQENTDTKDSGNSSK